MYCMAYVFWGGVVVLDYFDIFHCGVLYIFKLVFLLLLRVFLHLKHLLCATGFVNDSADFTVPDADSFTV